MPSWRESVRNAITKSVKELTVSALSPKRHLDKSEHPKHWIKIQMFRSWAHFARSGYGVDQAEMLQESVACGLEIDREAASKSTRILNQHQISLGGTNYPKFFIRQISNVQQRLKFVILQEVQP